MSERLRIFRSSLASGVLLMGVVLHAQAPPMVAHVLEVQGGWRVAGSATAIAAGQGLAAGAQVQPVSAAAGSSITIVRDADLSRTRVVCDGTATNPCRTPIVIGSEPAAPTETSQLKNIVQAAFAVLLGNPPAVESHYALTLSRGVEPDRESESVVAIDKAGNIFLPTAVGSMPAAAYSISVHSATLVKPAEEQSASLARDGHWTPLHLAVPGTYRFTVSDAEGHELKDVFLLVVPPAALEGESRRLAEVKGSIAGWQGAHARSDTHLFLRTFLIAEGNAL